MALEEIVETLSLVIIMLTPVLVGVGFIAQWIRSEYKNKIAASAAKKQN